MKKHIIAALVGVMILAVTAPAFAANVGGSMEFGYGYDLQGREPKDVTNDWSMNLTGNISDNVSYKVGFDTDAIDPDLDPMAVSLGQLLHPSEAWIQAKETPFGTVKLGAFDMKFGQGNSLAWQDEGDGSFEGIDDFPLNVQLDNEIAGMNVSAGAQFATDGEFNAVGAAATLEPLDALEATVGVRAKVSNSWDPELGYNVAYTGIENLALGVKGNLYDEELVGSADYQLMPEVAVNAIYGQNTANVDDEDVSEITKVGVAAALENGLHAGASYEMSTFVSDSSEHKIARLNAGYDYELAKGLVIGIDGDYRTDDIDGNESSIGVSAAVNF